VVGPPTNPGRARSRATCLARLHQTCHRPCPGPERTIPTVCPWGFRRLRLASAATTPRPVACLLWPRVSSELVDVCPGGHTVPLPDTRTGAHRPLRLCRTVGTPGFPLPRRLLLRPPALPH